MTLRVLHTVESLREDAGSVAICLPGLFDSLHSHAIESKVMTFDRNEEAHNAISVPVLRDSLIDLKTTGLHKDVDIVHIHGWGYPLAHNVAKEARKLGRPFVISPYGALTDGAEPGVGWKKRVRAWFGDRKVVRAAAAITAINETEEHALSQRRIEGNCVRLSCGLRVNDYESDSTRVCGENGRRLLLVLAPIHPAEGFVPLLKALAELGTLADGWDVVLAGRPVGDWQTMLEAAIRRKGGADRVRFVTASDTEAQRAWLSRASLLVAPSLHVRCPVSILQGVGAGVPVLATSCVIPERFQDVVRICAPTRGDMKIALRALLQLSDEERTTLGRQGRDTGRTLFDWPVLVDEYVRLYRHLA